MQYLPARKSQLLAVAAAVTLVGSTGGIAAAAQSPAAPRHATTSHAAPMPEIMAIQRGWSYVPEFASSPVIDGGTVLDSAGHPVADATVIVFPVLLNGGKPGSVLQPATRTISDGSGRFALRIPATRDALLMNRRTGGYLNMHVMAFYPGGVANWFTPVRAGHRLVPTEKLVLRHFAAGDGPSRAGSGTPAAAASPDICKNGTLHKIGNVPTDVGYKSSLSSKLDYATYQYESSTSTTMGAGISQTSAYSGFSASGTTTQSAGGHFTWPTMPGAGSNYLQAAGLWYDQEIVCSIPTGEYTQWDLNFNSLGSAYASPGAPAVSAGYCDLQEHNTVDTYNKGAQATFQYGANLEAAGVGINLSSQDGWSNTAYLTFATGSTSLPVCGVNNYPNSTGPSAGYLQVHS